MGASDLEDLAITWGTDKGEHQGFMPYYEKYLPPRGKAIRLLELGVYEGCSIVVWQKWFHAAVVAGLDIDFSNLLEHTGNQINNCLRTHLYKGDQGDPVVADAISPIQGWDVVIDDASHMSSKSIESFFAYWPHVKPGGLYVVEDTHCSYNTEHYGVREAAEPLPLWGSPFSAASVVPRPVTTMDYLKRLADDVNWNYHGYDRFEPMHRDVAFVHFYPGICFIGKKEA